jgi:hypothetical protein
MGNGSPATGTTVEIADIEGFPAKVQAIREAATDLGAIADELRDIAAAARTEITQFTRDELPSPIYGDAVNGLDDWASAAATLTHAVAEQVQTAATTISAKYTAITGTDIAAAADIHRI